MPKKSESKKQQKRKTEAQRELLMQINRAKYELECAMQNFSYATDPTLVDMYSYQIKACQAKYQYLIERAKSDNLTDAGSLLAFSF